MIDFLLGLFVCQSFASFSSFRSAITLIVFTLFTFTYAKRRIRPLNT